MGNWQETALELTPDAMRDTPDEVRAFNETIKALHSFAQNPDASRRRIIVSGRQCGKSVIAFEMYKRAFERATQGGSVDPPRRPWSRESGGVTIPCPWEKEDGSEMFHPAATGHIKPSVDLKPRREVDRLRTADILQAMTMRNATDQVIPEEWMDELDDLVWRERDRLAADAGS
jgi:hypothetical protein